MSTVSKLCPTQCSMNNSYLVVKCVLFFAILLCSFTKSICPNVDKYYIGCVQVVIACLPISLKCTMCIYYTQFILSWLYKLYTVLSVFLYAFYV